MKWLTIHWPSGKEEIKEDETTKIHVDATQSTAQVVTKDTTGDESVDIVRDIHNVPFELKSK